MKQKLVLQINSSEALERLIGGDPEIELQLKGSVVQEFAKRHLKGVMDEAALKGIYDTLHSDMENTGYYGWLEDFKKGGYFSSKKLTEAASDSIFHYVNLHLETAISGKIRESIDAVIQTEEMQTRIANVEQSLKSAIERIETYSATAIERQIDEAAKKIVQKTMQDLINKQ